MPRFPRNMDETRIRLKVPNEDAMQALGTRLARVCDAAVIFLTGQLGAGKTTLTRGFLRGMGYQGLVRSPTYTLVETYQARDRAICHFDFYRLRDPEELEYIGIQDYFDSKNICLVEWPECGAGKLPLPDMVCDIGLIPDGRLVQLTPHSARGNTMLHRFEYEK